MSWRLGRLDLPGESAPAGERETNVRLKATPDDFQVREATALRIRKKPGPYQVYLLEKRGWNTTDALMRIARAHRVPYARFSYGGKKDRHAHTFQYVTFAGRANVATRANGYQLTFLGYADRPMEPAQILANHFTLVLRELSAAETEAIGTGLQRVAQTGSINYFDDQRFGSMDRARGFIAEKLLQQRWEEALLLALTTVHPGEHRAARVRKRALRERWGDWEACRALAVTALEQRAFARLLADPGGSREVLATVHPETVNLWIAAYQSFLWNETVRRLVRALGACHAAPGVAGDYLFPARPVPALQGLVVPLPGRGMRFETPEPRAVLQGLLREREVAWGALERGDLLPGFTCKAAPREVVIFPQAMRAEPPEPDDLYPGTARMTLRFSLPKGAYATMLVKAVTARAAPGSQKGVNGGPEPPSS